MPMANQELTPLPEATLLETVMRAARDPTVDPARLEKLLEIGRQLEKDRAVAAFNADFAALKKELPVIAKNGVVLNKSGRVQFTYARYDDLHEAVTPLLQKFGFATSFSFEEPGEGRLTCVLELTHSRGHSKPYRWTLPGAGENQYVSNLQNAAAARTFAKRCVLIDALDILTKDVDRDGAPPEAAPERITEKQAREIEDMAAACENRRKGFSARFAKWLKAEIQVEQIRDLFQGAQHKAVLQKLREKMEEMGVQ